MRIRSYAKINLSLEITGRRADGLHRIVSVMQTVTLADTLSVERASERSFQCSDPGLVHGNLVTAAADAFARKLGGRDAGYRIRLTKAIPAGAGLGGGSGDAAATLRCLNALHGEPLDAESISQLAASLGSDVPFFLHGGTCLVQGVGELVSPLPRPAPAWYLLVKPEDAISTGQVYAALTPEEWTDGSVTLTMAGDIRNGIPGAPGFNGLQEALFRICPQALRCFRDVQDTDPLACIVSGSGTTIIGLFQTEAAATEAGEMLSGNGYWHAVVTNPDDSDEVNACS
ncbi:MAG: 4-(cytidine 5'-diphospho)-2-C-methyl-D-erythritol kinase [Chloroflexota bacterium]